MIRKSVIGIASVVAMLTAAACDSGDHDGMEERDADVVDGGTAEPDASAADGGVKQDADVDIDGGEPDGGGSADAGEMDAAPDAELPVDAQTEDAGGDVPDAEADLDGAADAASLDAAPDANVEEPDTSVVDASLPTLAAHYTFDENTGTVAADSTDAFADAVLIDGAGWTTGQQGSALDLAGAPDNSYVSLPVDILDGCDEDITIALSMRLGSLPPWARLLDIDGVENGFLYFTPTQDVGGEPHLLFNIFHPTGEGTDDQGVSAAYPEGTVLVDTWHHVAFTLSGGTGRLYFNGVEIGSNAMTTAPSDLTLGDAAHAWLGRSTFNNDPYLDAAIDDLRVSCTAYSAAQVAALVD